MRKSDMPIVAIVSADEKSQSKKFWQKAFLIYAIVEVVIILTQYITTSSQCVKCVMPPGFYVVNFLQHLLFTGLLWYCLNRLYHLRGWKIIGINILLFAVHYFFWIAILYTIFQAGLNWLTWPESPKRSIYWFVYGSWIDIAKYFAKLSAFYVLKFYVEFRKAEQQRIRLAIINKDMQLNLLKQQLSPHFYFNTLNNLYGLAISNNGKLPVALHQLSNIMQYVIVDCNQPKVLLSQEINFLQSYIALEKLRYEQDIIIEMKVTGEAANKTIIPLLLIQFVENAFKHGMKEKSERNWMKVNLLIDKEELLFNVQNSYYAASTIAGIGINSVKHILNLQYEGKYDIQMIHEDHRFSVTLKLNLS